MASEEEHLQLERELLGDIHGNESVRELTCSSDELHDVTCSPCVKEGRNVAAEKYCMECANYLCVTCLKQHNRFGVMQTHRVLPVEKARTKNSNLPIQQCVKHRGQNLSIYCGLHDDVCCSICASIDHSTCKSKSFVLDIVEESVVFKQDWQDLSAHIANLEASLKQLRSILRDREDAREQDKSKVVRQIRYIRKVVAQRFDYLEKILMESVENNSEESKTEHETELHKLNYVETVLSEQKHALEMLGDVVNPASVFVQTKLAKTALSEVEPLTKAVENASLEPLYFLPNTNIWNVLDCITELGSLVESISNCSADLERIVYIKTPSEPREATISGVCSVDDGTLLIADSCNKSLKRLDTNYNIVEHLELPDKPYDVCKIEDTLFAISLTKAKKVQFVSIEPTMDLKSAFSVSGTCRGIAYSNRLLYVACGGWGVSKEGKGIIEVYSTSGVLQRIIDDHILRPAHIALSGSHICIADNINGLVILNKCGSLVSTFTHRDMDDPLAVCAGPGNLLFLGGWSSHNVMALTNGGLLLSTPIPHTKGVKNIHTLHYDELRSRLIYSSRDANKMRIYNIVFKC